MVQNTSCAYVDEIVRISIGKSSDPILGMTLILHIEVCPPLVV